MASLFDSGLSSDFFSSDFFSSDFFSAGLELLFLKSVAYQPLPFNWNPAALRSFWKVGLRHTGHSVSGGSVTRCRNSSW